MSLTYSECLHCLFSPVNKLMLSYLKKCFCVYLAASVVTRGQIYVTETGGCLLCVRGEQECSSQILSHLQYGRRLMGCLSNCYLIN